MVDEYLAFRIGWNQQEDWLPDDSHRLAELIAAEEASRKEHLEGVRAAMQANQRATPIKTPKLALGYA